MDVYRMGRMGGLCVRTVLWMEGWMGVEELTTHDEQFISSSSLDVGWAFTVEPGTKSPWQSVNCRA